jgi:hypothetical protein
MKILSGNASIAQTIRHHGRERNSIWVGSAKLTKLRFKTQSQAVRNSWSSTQSMLGDHPTAPILGRR